jgi:RNA-binding protein 5/10
MVFSHPSFIQSAASVLAATMSPQIHLSGFRISDKPVAASFTHQYSLQQVDHMLRDEIAIPLSINLGGVEGAFMKYWDDSAMVAVLEFKVDAPPQPQVQASTGLTKEKKKGVPADCSFLSHKLTGKYIDDASNMPPAPSALPISDKPVMLSFNKGGPGSKPITSLSGPKAPVQIFLGFSTEDFAAEDDDAEAATSMEDNKGSFICSRQLSEYELTFGSDCIENGCSTHRKQEGSFYCV